MRVFESEPPLTACPLGWSGVEPSCVSDKRFVSFLFSLPVPAPGGIQSPITNETRTSSHQLLLCTDRLLCGQLDIVLMVTRLAVSVPGCGL
jgi:hypothetical protein